MASSLNSVYLVIILISSLHLPVTLTSYPECARCLLPIICQIYWLQYRELLIAFILCSNQALGMTVLMIPGKVCTIDCSHYFHLSNFTQVWKKFNDGNWWIKNDTMFYFSLFLGSSVSRAPSGTKWHWGFVETKYNIFPEGNSFMKRSGILVILLMGRNQGFWSHLEFSWRNISDYF